MNPAVLVLDNPIQNYAWGSRTAIAELLGRPAPSSEPEAELWIGAHPKAPSRIAEPKGRGTLDRAIQDDPVALLGAEVCDRFGNELPFLLKVLAAAEPLSIQAHPNQEQARSGWARENAEGIPLDAPRRSYRDLNHKPELVCALGPFVALKGFRPIDQIARGLQPLARPELAHETSRLAREQTPAALRALFARLMTLDPDERGPLVKRAAAEAARRDKDPAWRWVARLAQRHPGDPGVLAPLYLNLVTLAADEALFLAAGELHAYLEGTALEIMANSDNVLRGGLTPKHVDVQELLAVLTFDAQAAEVLEPQADGPGLSSYKTPAREFELGFLEIAPERPFSAPPGRGVEILLQVEGGCRLRGDDGCEVALARGRSVLVPAAIPGYVLTGEGRVARARVPA
jgi:mannose-6-phosphate isomerase